MIKKFVLFLLASLFLVGGFGFSTSLGGSTDKGKASLAPQGTTTISAKSTGSDAEQTTRATIGGGSITVASGGTDGLNRNVSLAQEITKELITSALDGNMTIDNRVFTSSGWDSIIADYEVAVDAALETGGYVADKVGELIDIMFPEEPEVNTYSKTFTSLTQYTSNYAKEGLTLEEQPKFTYKDGFLCSSGGNCIYDPPLEPLYPIEELVVGGAVAKPIGAGLSWVGEVTGVTAAISSATSAVGLWFGKLFGKNTVHIAEKAAERGVSNSAIKDALKKPLKITEIKYDSLGRPSVQFIGKKSYSRGQS